MGAPDPGPVRSGMEHDTEVALIERILGLAERKTRELAPAVHRSPVSHYLDRARHERELAVLFRRHPVIVAHASELARPGDFVTHRETGVPILVLRDEVGVRAFVNVCRHRGG
ncbi:MAG: Rieske 2Fe-2S domain-containing protein, partial [Alphaproteobacteria bacterium]